MSMSQYVQEAVNNVEGYLRKRWLVLPKKSSTPVATNYSPELDGSDGLNVEDLTDTSFAGCRVTQQSRTGCIVYLNSAPIYYMSKKHGLCETSTFGSEFVKMNQCC